MKSPTEEEFEESIKELSEYKNRLEKEVVTISQKLKMPQRKIKSIIVESSDEIYKLKDSADVFGIDEAQFFDDGIIDIANKLAREDKRIVIAGLDKDYTGKSFGPIHQLLVDAE